MPVTLFLDNFSKYFLDSIHIIHISSMVGRCAFWVSELWLIFSSAGRLTSIAPFLDISFNWWIDLSHNKRTHFLCRVVVLLGVTEVWSTLITPITSIINLSLTEGSFPSRFKFAHVSPLLKKPSLNKDSRNNYWLMSNLSFLSKVLEKVVVNQPNSHINSSNTSKQYQSAYRKFHSTKTARVKIHYDILTSMDAGKVTALRLLDLSAAFNTIDHTILPRRLDDWFGVTGKALDRFKSYLTGVDTRGLG